MKHFITNSFFIFLLCLLCSAYGYSQEYEPIKDKSTIKFTATAKMFGVNSEVNGKFASFSIHALRKPKLEDSTLEVTIAVSSIDTGITRRDRHLKSSDFFDEKRFKSIVFKSKKIRHLKNDTYEIAGTLTIKHKTTHIVFHVTAQKLNADDHWRIKGETKFNRNLLGIDYKSPFYLPDVGDEIKAHIDVQLKPKAKK